MSKYLTYAAIGVVLAGLFPNVLLAITYGNLARKHTPGQVEVGVLASQTTRTFDVKATVNSSAGSGEGTDSEDFDIASQDLYVGLGVNENLALGALIGNIKLKEDVGESFSGHEYGGFLSSRLPGGSNGVDLGVMLAYRTSAVSDRFFDARGTMIDAGFGVTKALTPTANLYFDGILSTARYSLVGNSRTKQEAADELTSELGFPVSVSSANVDLTEKSPLIVVAGLDVMAAENLLVSLELHAVGETGFAIGIAGVF